MKDEILCLPFFELIILTYIGSHLVLTFYPFCVAFFIFLNEILFDIRLKKYIIFRCHIN